MRLRKLGRTGYLVSEIGHGTWGMGRTEWLDGEDEDARQALFRSLEGGVTLFDTAYAYGDGHSERLLAGVLAEHGGADIVVATKVPPRNLVWPGHAEIPLEEIFPASYVGDMVEASLRNLRTEALQIEQLHVWNDAWLDSPAWGETRSAMVRLQEQGKVLHWGVSINDHAPETALRIAADPLIETVQVIYNIFDRRPETALFDLARSKDLGVIARCPLDEGALAGTVSPDTVFPRGDFRREYFGGDRKVELADRLRALRSLLGKEAQTLPELALRFCLSRPEVSTVIPGMRHERHVLSNVSTSDGRLLSDSVLARLEDHAWDKNWYEGF